MNKLTNLKPLILESKDGEWGKEEAFGDSIEMTVIRGTDFEDVKIGSMENVPTRFIPTAIAQRKKICPYDILIETAGGAKNRSTGRTLLIKPSMLFKSTFPVTCASFSRFIRINPQVACPSYVFWVMQYLHKYGFMSRYNTQHTGLSRFQFTIFSESEKFPLPPLPIQQKIAAILSTYDDLIENNTRRIRILKEMAQALYCEWFINFRFPGYEDVQMADSKLGPIPDGWEVVPLGDHLSVLETGKRPFGGATVAEGGIPSIGAENVNGIANHNYSAEKYVPNDFFLQMHKGIVKNRDVALYKDGAYIGRSTYFRDGFPHHVCCVNEHVFLLRSNDNQLTQNILYLWLQEQSTVNAIRATNANAAQPGINQNGIRRIEMILPPHDLALEFDELVEPLLAKIINNAKCNQILRRIRDLLLPKLISGELDVSELDIRIPEAEV